MNTFELNMAKARMRAVLIEADRKYQLLLEERKQTGTVRKLTREEMINILLIADRSYLEVMASRGASGQVQKKVIRKVTKVAPTRKTLTLARIAPVGQPRPLYADRLLEQQGLGT